MLSRSTLHRRDLLRIGSLGAVGLTLPDLLRAEATTSAKTTSAADSCILIFLNGGPSHLDMWDMKPTAPDGIRGEFKPIASTVPGIQVCELLPRLAQQMHRFSLVRSMHHTVNNAHALAVYTSLTGHDRGDANMIVGEGLHDYPTPGSLVSLKRPGPRDVPPHVVLPYLTKEGANGPPQPGFYGGFLGRAHDPLFVLKDPNRPEFNIPELTLLGEVNPARLWARRELLDRVGKGLAHVHRRPGLEALDEYQQRAFDLLSSPAAQRAIAIGSESSETRERYGRNIYGQSVLLARRLIEAGTRVVTLSWAPDANSTWDTHGANFTKLKSTLLPQFDAACTSLVEDLVERGMYERTLVAVLGDFGRSPKINANAGRDHWNLCYTVMLGGGGLKGGFVYGASDAIGGLPARDPLGPGDVIATIYQQLGIQPDQMIYDQFSRPHRLVANGDAVAALVA